MPWGGGPDVALPLVAALAARGGLSATGLQASSRRHSSPAPARLALFAAAAAVATVLLPRLDGLLFAGAAGRGVAALHSGLRHIPSRVARGARMDYHARDPYGVRHVETRKQAREASTMKTTLESILQHCEVEARRLGDDEIQRRVRVDDVIMSKDCHAAYIHVAAEGDMLERRQAFVWIVRNKGSVKTALAKRYKKRGRIPDIYFVESKFSEWVDLFAKARKYPEMNLPNPFSPLEQVMREKLKTRDKTWQKWGMGDPNSPYPPWGYSDA